MTKPRRLATVVVGWLALAGLVLASAGAWPRTLTAWMLTILIGPIAFLLASGLGDLIHRGFSRLPGVERAGEWAERQGRWPTISIVRVAVYAGVALTVAIPIFAILFWLIAKDAVFMPAWLRGWWTANFHGGV